MANAVSQLQDAATIRKERVHTTMLIELLALLIFMSMAFAFVMKEEGDRTNPWKEKALALQAQIGELTKRDQALQREARQLRAQISLLEASIRRLVAEHQGPLAANDWLTLPKAELKRQSDQTENVQAMADELRRENRRLREQLAAAKGKGGTSLPKCAVTAGFLYSIELLGDDTMIVHPSWTAGAADSVRLVPGALALASGAPISARQFSVLAGQVASWGLSQTEPCRFSVSVTNRHSDLNLYKRQVGTIEQQFYDLRR